MSRTPRSRDNDPGIVKREYETEERFLARRLTTHAELDGPLVEDAAIVALAEAAPRRVLEVGCGTGDVSARAASHLSAEYVATDLSRRMAHLTSARGLRTALADINAMPFAGEVFDCVLANRVLYHVPDLSFGLRELARVLGPGGALVAVTYSERHLWELWNLVGSSPLASASFSAENGARALAAYFEHVERRDVTGRAVFRTLEAIRLHFESQGEFAEYDYVKRLPAVSVPFEATYRHALFVAHKANR